MSHASTEYDAIVVGVGGMGSATTYHLAERGLDVLGIERYDIPHAMGSSHGVTRIIRRAYFEHPAYIPLVERAFDLWEELDARSGREILHRTGSIDASAPDGDVFTGSKRSCEEHGIPHEVLTGAEINERFPGYDLPPEYRGVYQEDGGFVASEQAIIAHTEAAQQAGATVHAREEVREWTATESGVRVETDRDTYTAEKLVLTAGAWNGEHVEALDGLLSPERQVLGWFQPDRPAAFEPDTFPVWNLETPEGTFYGLPIYDVPGMKLGKYNHREEEVDPNDWNREPNRADERILRTFTERYFADAAGPMMGLSTCMFTNTPDEHFVLDHLPDHPNVVVGAGFSGHGFKFASAIGEVLTDLVVDGKSDHPTEMFSLDRFDDVGEGVPSESA